MRGALESLATLHDYGIVHRSIGRSSVVLSSVGQDKAEASDVYSTVVTRLVVKLSDLGFATRISTVHIDDEFRARARAFGLHDLDGTHSTRLARNFAIAEDLHALGFVFLGLLLTSLADLSDKGGAGGDGMSGNKRTLPPNTDDDGLQRLLGDIFSGSFDEFRSYVADEGEIWSNVVALLDSHDGAGWELLEDMCLARERVGELKEGDLGTTARTLLDNPIFTTSSFAPSSSSLFSGTKW